MIRNTLPLLVLLIVGGLFVSTASKLSDSDSGLIEVYPLDVPTQGKTGFKLLSSEKTGVTFVNTLKDEQAINNQILNNGSGVATGDVDGDGLVDIYFARLDGANALYKNLGNWRFEEITSKSVELSDQFSSGANLVDFDGDRDLDLLVTGVGTGVRAFKNDGRGEFREVTRELGLEGNLGSTSMALADIEGDGDLDLYVSNYRTTTIKDHGEKLTLKRKPDGTLYVPAELEDRIQILSNKKIRELGEPDYLYINDGSGRFRLASWSDGRFKDREGTTLTKPVLDWGLSVIFRDMDLDGDPDLYVCNDFETPERIWINDGKGNFQEISTLAVRHTSATSMGVDFADIDGDGDYDFYVVDMLSQDHQLRKKQMGTMQPTPISIGEIDTQPQIMRNTLFLNRGDNTYAEIANLSGVHATDWSWSPLFIDFDLDGYQDLFVTNGHMRDVQDADTQLQIQSLGLRSAEEKRKSLLLYPKLQTGNVAFRNRGDLRFEDVSNALGLDQRVISHGVASADLDNDGDLDLVVSNLGNEPGVYQNQSSAPRIAVRLKGVAPNTQAVGAQLRLEGNGLLQQREVVSGGRYLSGSDGLLVFATPVEYEPYRLVINWRDGKQTEIDQVTPNNLYIVDQRSARTAALTPQPTSKKLFEDVSAILGHTHHENEFDDFKRQSLLPNRLSQNGPGVSWYDLNDDGRDELVITSGRGKSPSIFHVDEQGAFQAMPLSLGDEVNNKDQTAAIGWRPIDGTPTLMIGLSNFEDGQKKDEPLAAIRLEDGEVQHLLQGVGSASSVGPLALADVDGDGDLDLFVGGRTIPGRYPEPASSQLYLNHDSNFQLDLERSKAFEKLGLVSGAIFSDIDSDGDQDLVLALEWGPITVLKNEDDGFIDATSSLGLDKYPGWWNGVTTGDFDEDGSIDIAATNWGLNSKYHYDAEHPLKTYYDDFDGNGVLDIVETHFDTGMGQFVPERGLSCSSRAMPFVKKQFPTFSEFGAAGIDEIYGAAIATAPYVMANSLEHRVFLNRDDHFKSSALPIEAQLSPGFGINVADVDGDGHDDLFISQNFSASQVETPRIDAGRGLWMLGNGRGTFEPLSGERSGVEVYGDGRGSAVGDFNGDGRIDLAVAQNGAATKLYRNVHAKPGLRIRLIGPAKNRDAIGASVRVRFEGRLGPARELRAGSGYWSQDSLIQVMGTPTTPLEVQVRWPDGEFSLIPLKEDLKEIVVHYDEVVGSRSS